MLPANYGADRWQIMTGRAHLTATGHFGGPQGPVELVPYRSGLTLRDNHGRRAVLSIDDPLDGARLALDLLVNSLSRAGFDGKEDTLERLEQWLFGKKETNNNGRTFYFDS